MHELKNMRLKRNLKQRDVVRVLKVVDRRMTIPLFSAIENETVLPTTKTMDSLWEQYFNSDREVSKSVHKVDRRVRALHYPDTYKMTVCVPTELISAFKEHLKLDGYLSITEWVKRTMEETIKENDRDTAEAESPVAAENRRSDSIIDLFVKLVKAKKDRVDLMAQIEHADDKIQICNGGTEQIHLYKGIDKFLCLIGEQKDALKWKHDPLAMEGQGHHTAEIMWNGIRVMQITNEGEELE